LLVVLGWVGLSPNFSICSGLGWVGLGQTKWTHGQLCVTNVTNTHTQIRRQRNDVG